VRGPGERDKEREKEKSTEMSEFADVIGRPIDRERDAPFVEEHDGWTVEESDTHYFTFYICPQPLSGLVRLGDYPRSPDPLTRAEHDAFEREVYAMLVYTPQAYDLLRRLAHLMDLSDRDIPGELDALVASAGALLGNAEATRQIV
jgi:hypothetical protein